MIEVKWILVTLCGYQSIYPSPHLQTYQQSKGLSQANRSHFQSKKKLKIEH